MKKIKHNTVQPAKAIKSNGSRGANIRQDRCNKLHKNGKKLSNQSLGIQLLTDALAVFKTRTSSKIRSKRLITLLCADPQKHWATLGHSGKPISARKLSSILKEFKVHSRDIRFKAGVFKGYRRQWIKKAYRLAVKVPV